MNITIEEINKGIIPRTRSNGLTGTPCDIYISYTTKGKRPAVHFNYYFADFRNYKYVVLSRVGNKLFFRLTNADANNNAYKISRKHDGSAHSTSVSGKNAKLLKAFVGRYLVKQYDWRRTPHESIYYIDSEDKIC